MAKKPTAHQILADLRASMKAMEDVCAVADMPPELHAEPGSIISSMREAAALIDRILVSNQDPRLTAFVNALLDRFWDPSPGDINGGEFQDLCEEHGILLSTTRTALCGESCACAEFFDGTAFECFRRADWLTSTLASEGGR